MGCAAMRDIQTTGAQQMTEIVQTKNNAGDVVWRIIVNGQPHPVDFIDRMMALAHMGLLRSRGFAEQRVA